MKYLSLDIEATGLDPHDLIIELAFIPFDTQTKDFEKSLSKHFYIKCPSFEELKPKLNPWVIEHNETLIKKAHQEGLPLQEVKKELTQYFESSEVLSYFGNEKITLFGKSMNAIDLPFLTRDFGEDFMKKYFSHKILDLSSIAFGLIDLNFLPQGTDSSSSLMQHFSMGEVAHTALEDAVAMAEVYFKVLEKFAK